MGDSLLVRFLKGIFKLIWKILINALYILGKLAELILIQLNNLLKQYL